MINVKAVADYLASTSNGSAADTELIASLLTFANQLANQSSGGGGSGAASTSPAAGEISTQASAPSSSFGGGGGGAICDSTAAAAVPRGEGNGGAPLLFGRASELEHGTESEMETLAEGMRLFVQRYPVDARAYEYLVTSTPMVVAHVLRDFRPPREGDPDYSGILTAYVKRIRGQYSTGASAQGGKGGGGASTAPPLRNPSVSGADDVAPAPVPALRSAVCPAALAGSRGTALLDELAALVGGIRPASADAAAGADLLEAVQVFTQKYPVDDRAYNYLANAPPQVQMKVMREFKPRSSGESNYSALLTTFTKKCMDAPALEAPSPAPAPLLQPLLALAPPAITPTSDTSGNLTPALAKELEAFLAKYPIDDRALEYLTSSSAEVLTKVFAEFQPYRTGESGYSAILTAFVKKCRSSLPRGCTSGGGGPPWSSDPASGGGLGGFVCLSDGSAGNGDGAPSSWVSRPFAAAQGGNELPPLWAPGAMGDLGDGGCFGDAGGDLGKAGNHSSVGGSGRTWGSAGGGGVASDFGGCDGVGGGQASSSLIVAGSPPENNSNVDLDAFRARFPMDARAFDFLSTASPEVQARCIETFVPPRLDDVDFSAPVTAYIRSLRQQATEAHTAASVSEEAVARFFDRYPCDSRAFDYFHMSTVEVQAQVLRDFKPRQEGEADYSAAITAYVKRCRAQQQESGGSSWRPSGSWGGGPPQSSHVPRSAQDWRRPPPRAPASSADGTSWGGPPAKRLRW